MSEIVTLSISAVALGVTGIVVPTAAAAIALAVAGARLSAQSRRMLEELTAPAPRTVDSISPSPQLPVQSVRSTTLPRHEARLLTELASAASLAGGDPAHLAATLRARPVEEWAGLIRQNHDQLFRQSLTDAIGRACLRLDFRAVEIARGQIHAEDQGGRGLAVQISDDGAIKAEILGVADGTCHLLVDRFLEALKSEGVQIAKVNDRRWTGGAPQTEAGRGWVSKKVQRPAAAGQSKPAERRIKGGARQARVRSGA